MGFMILEKRESLKRHEAIESSNKTYARPSSFVYKFSVEGPNSVP